MNLNPRQRWLAIAAGVTVALFAGERLVVNPTWRAWSSRAERLAALKKRVADGEILLSREKGIRERWQTMRSRTLTNEVSAAENQMLKALDRWTQDSRVTVLSIKPQWKRADDDYSTVECRVDALGSLQMVTRLLYDVETAARSSRDPLALKVESVEISARGDNGDQLGLGLQVSGLILNPPSKR
jgi:hypothetical protein